MSVNLVASEVTSDLEARPSRWRAVDVGFSNDWPSETGRLCKFARGRSGRLL